jgi:hypothetical protein
LKEALVGVSGEGFFFLYWWGGRLVSGLLREVGGDRVPLSVSSSRSGLDRVAALIDG